MKKPTVWRQREATPSQMQSKNQGPEVGTKVDLFEELNGG